MVSRETSLSVTKREKRRFDFLRASDEAYENAANVLAIQRAEDAADAQLDKLELDHSVDPKAYQEGAEAWIKGYVGGDIPPWSRRNGWNLYSRQDERRITPRGQGSSETWY